MRFLRTPERPSGSDGFEVNSRERRGGAVSADVVGPFQQRGFRTALSRPKALVQDSFVALHETLREIAALEEAGVIERYAIGGAVGATRYAQAAETEDVDVFVTFAVSEQARLDPLGAIYEFLRSRGAALDGPYVRLGDWPVQFLPAIGPLLEEAIADALEVEVDGFMTRIFTAEHLAALALDLGRAKDKVRVVMLRESRQFDSHRFLEIVQRHGLAKKWDAFSKAFLT